VGQAVSPSLAAAALFPVVSLLALGAWVYIDASAREETTPALWAVPVALFGPLIVVYVLQRGERTRPQSDGERAALTVLLALLVAMMAGTVFSPPDTFAQPRNTFGALLVALPLFYLLVYRDGATGEPDGSNGSDGESADEN
jgi:hypothetical protein